MLKGMRDRKYERCYTRNEKDYGLRNKPFMIILKEKQNELFKVNVQFREDFLRLRWKWTQKNWSGKKF